jgi:hypothetical protein
MADRKQKKDACRPKNDREMSAYATGWSNSDLQHSVGILQSIEVKSHRISIAVRLH